MREKGLVRTIKGIPISKVRNEFVEFVPSNPVDAKQMIKNDNFTLFRE
jgi:hypothetical protein